MTLRLLFFIVLVQVACFPIPPAYQAPEKIDYKQLYNSSLLIGETYIMGNYNTCVSRKADGKFIKRTFYRDSVMVMTQYAEFNGKSMRNSDGVYKEWWDNGDLSKEGMYVNNLPVGQWKYYSNGKLSSTGTFENGKRNGTWDFYNEEGELAKKKEFENGELMDESILIEPKNPSKGKVKVQTLPYLSSCKGIADPEERKECSNQALLKSIYSMIQYPAKDRVENVEGTAIASFVVNKDGSVSDLVVKRGISPSIKKEVIRVMNQLPSWEPGQQDGKNVKVVMNIPVKFKLE